MKQEIIFLKNKAKWLMSKMDKMVCANPNYVEHLILTSTITGCISISAFTSLICIPIAIMSSAIGSVQKLQELKNIVNKLNCQ